MLSFKYALDKRTEKEAENNFRVGINAQNRIIRYLKIEHKVDIISEDEQFGVINKYKPDIKIDGIPVEIKYTDKNISYFDLKANQVENLSKLGGYFFIVKEIKGIGYYFTILAKDALKLKRISLNTYCNKPCYRIEKVEWKMLKYKL